MTPPRTQATPAGGRRMDLRAIGFAGHRRDEALKAADVELDRIVDEVLAAGEHANVTLAARLGNVSRNTLYRRLAERQAGAASRAAA